MKEKEIEQTEKEKELKVLLADDDLDDRQFFDKALKSLPVSTNLTTVNDGEELMDYLNSNTNPLPDILFLDINMPRKNGQECLQEIKRNEKLRDLPLVMFSTSNSWDKINTLFKTGANVYIHKPSDFSQLKQVIQHALPIATEKNSTANKIKYILNA